MNERIEPKETAHQSNESSPEGIASTQVAAAWEKTSNRSIRVYRDSKSTGKTIFGRRTPRSAGQPADRAARSTHRKPEAVCGAADESALKPSEVKDKECGAYNPRADCPQRPINRVNGMER